MNPLFDDMFKLSDTKFWLIFYLTDLKPRFFKISGKILEYLEDLIRAKIDKINTSSKTIWRHP